MHRYPVGYNKLAAYQECDPSFLIFRKFAFLRNHVLLDLQDELQYLEERLEKHNGWEFEHGNKDRLISRRLDYEENNSRKGLIQKIDEALAKYGKFQRSSIEYQSLRACIDALLLRAQKIQAIKRPARRNQNSVYNRIHEEQNIMRSEEHWIRRSEDLAALARDAEDGWLNGFVEDSLNSISRRLLVVSAFVPPYHHHLFALIFSYCPKHGAPQHLTTPIQKIFSNKELRIRSANEPYLYLVSPHRIDILLRTFLTIFASILLLIPVLILVKLQPHDQSELERQGNYQLLTVFIFTLVFSFCCSIFTKAKRQEVFSATAAYAAVLVIFLGNSNGQGLVR